MTTLLLTIGPLTFRARWESEVAPNTCTVLQGMLPLDGNVLQARWSGQAGWVPLGARDIDLPPENATSYPAPGEVLFYPGGLSETELLIPYGPTCFASKAGQLAGNHCLTIFEGSAQLAEVGRLIVWEGAQSFLAREDS